ncbi:unnamed protein product [Rotaria sp. Silwood2]|nr:unnamed protein product [Rotaria sp. Silwood2]
MSLRNMEKAQFELIFDIILSTSQTDWEKLQMLEECRYRYKDNQNGLKIIDEFEITYTSDKALQWYTRDSFLFRLVNEACRTENVDQIYTFRCFLSDLSKQLYQLHSSYISELRNSGIDIFTVYRGQRISAVEFQEIQQNIGQLYSTNTFLSTTYDRDVALKFAGTGAERPKFESVLFQYVIDLNINTKPFANISHESYMKHENEILLSIGTVFCIDSVYPSTENNVWHVTLTLVSTTKEDIALKFELDQRPMLLLLGSHLASVMKDFDKAERYYRLFLEEHATADPSLLTIRYYIEAYNGLGQISTFKGEFATALEHYEAAFRLTEEHLNNENISMAQAYENIAYVYEAKRDYKNAIQIYQKAIELRADNYISQGQLFNKIGDLFANLTDWASARKMYQKAVESHFIHPLCGIYIDDARSYFKIFSITAGSGTFGNGEHSVRIHRKLPY